MYTQNELLAKNYFEQGDYEKALSIYDKLHRKNPNRLDYLLDLVETHQQLENFGEAEKLLQKRLSNPRRILPQLYVDLGRNYSYQENDSLATISYNKAISYIDTRPEYAYNIGKAFEDYSLLDEAAICYERAMELVPERNFNSQLARIYGEQGKLDKMFEKYLDLMETNPAYRAVAQRNFSMYVTEEATNESNTILRKILLRRLQNNPNVLYNETLSWLFIQQKDFKRAFTQEKAIFKRGEGDLTSLVDLALITMAEEDYTNATPIVEYIIDKAPSADSKLQGYQYLLKIALATAEKKDFPDITQQFENLLNEYGRGAQTHLLQIDYNHFLAFQAEKKEEAISNLKTLSKKKLTTYQAARVKMELADILVFDEKFNQALIYYSQIQNKIRNNTLAQQARFKVAKTSYYKGDFEWAQIQLDVLKKSASQLIANDAMELSLMIRDNSLEDSTQTALKKFAKADLLALQQKNSAAIQDLEQILLLHKGEKIEDEVLLKQAGLFELTNQFEKAAANYLKIIEFYNEDILADDAHFRLGKLYETKLAQPEQAKQYYEQLIFNFADSIYFVEARKRFRRLRGDAIN